ncbi:Zn-dependent exopeptidase [Auriscalpium vulgare]|uniref:Zn-dependent exopeptidase n=1 Tax=Auriscalpium vulgare TaxID=40419 RepID=A0ACB8S507_9AGAM|nr:Zn-dependent exopeptidase [Auriscalpium vulgare]
MSFAKLASALAVLAVYPHDFPSLTSDPCLADNFYGTYGGQSVFVAPHACFTGFATPVSGAFAPAEYPAANGTELVWVEQVALDASLQSQSPSFSPENISGYLSDLFASTSEVSLEGAQQALSLSAPTYAVLHHTATSVLLALPTPHAHRLSLVLPPTWKVYALPDAPLPIVPVEEPAIERVREILAALKFDPLVAKVVANISLAQIRNDIRWLTGEDGKSGIESRHSFSSGALTAADWLKVRFEETGAACELRPFLSGFAPNVICRYPSTVNTTATVLISSHYDSRGSFGSTRAPGGDDDGSGTTGILAIARTIKRLGLTFRSNVEIVAFAGEEQGLYGSRYYAQDLRKEDKNLTLMIQADMTAYHEPGEPPQLGLPDLIGTPEVHQLVANISAIYSPELKVGLTPACCSDHQSFHSQGFPASQVFERAGPIADPMYHNSGDLSSREGYDVEQLKSIAKVQFAVVLHTAGFDLP